MADRYRKAFAAALTALCLASCAFADKDGTVPARTESTSAAASVTTAAATTTTAVTTTTAAPTTTEAAATTTTTTTTTATTTANSEPELENTVEPDYIVGDGKPRIYDIKPIAVAYRTGDRSKLDDTADAILDKAAEILDELITEDMTDYDKELAIHDYLVQNCTYDHAALAVIPKTSPNSDNPYGALINGEAICTGYTTAFSLFMDMLGIPCETVYHCAPILESDHAWNIVELDGAKYYVDVTWDDPVPDVSGRLTHREYFNVSREYIGIDHTLSYICPKTTVMKDSYAEHNLSDIPKDAEQLAEMMKEALNHDRNLLFFRMTGDSPLTDWTTADGAPDRTKYKLFRDMLSESALESGCTVQWSRVTGITDGKVLEIKISKLHLHGA